MVLNFFCLLLSLNMIFLGTIYVVANGNISSFLMAELYFIVYVYLCLFPCHPLWAQLHYVACVPWG